MKKFILCIIVFSFITFTLSGCSAQDESSSKGQTSITMYTSIYPLYDFAKKIGQNKVEVNLIVPPGSEPHDWEPSAKLMAQMEKADILVYNGLGMELWAEKVIASINPSKLTVVNASENVELLKLEDDEHDDEVNHISSEYDPHVWLDPINAIIQAENIKNALVKVDVKNKVFYEDNFNTLKKHLQELDEEYLSTLSRLPRKEIVVSHAAFGYLANRYGLNQLSISGLSPQAEPSPSEMAHISDFIKEHNIKYIFFETLSNPKLAEVIAKETGAKASVLNPLGGLSKEELDIGKDYFSVMKENLASLKEALGEEK